jgi:TatD DNase family protein
LSSSGIIERFTSDKMVWVTVGLHPKRASQFTSVIQCKLEAFIRGEKVVAVGEIGLDYSQK